MAKSTGPSAFTGFPVAALDFYDDLEADNTKSFWEANKPVYDEAVRAPMTALMESLAPEFAPDHKSVKIFRPYRDVRFSKDKTPYKTAQGAFIQTAPASGFYLQLGAGGVLTGAGFYDADAARLAAFRDAIVDEATGTKLARIITKLEKAGFTRGGDTLKTSPRGYDADHPRIDLLRHKSLTLGRDLGFGPEISTPGLLDQVREDWRKLRPFVDWIVANTGA
ncbi:DUF2461 domain-containing protein [Nocardioides sp.]|uniref:DUF2461 domain-containing protein n=1 Tax=Nocardioides sp. TaxID=35761 RepID=UPI0035653639